MAASDARTSLCRSPARVPPSFIIDRIDYVLQHTTPTCVNANLTIRTAADTSRLHYKGLGGTVSHRKVA